MSESNYPFLPVSAKEMKMLGWNYADVILFTGDAYIDHPSFGAAVIGRVLTSLGYKVAIVPQPNWRDDLRDFKKMGRPRLFFGVTAGAMDSMVNHYTANRRLRSDDSYTPEGKAGFRPDYPTIVYTKILKELYPDVPVVLGGIEASLRRVAHYDYWKDSIEPSVLLSSGADVLVYGMGERAITDIAALIGKKGWQESIKRVPQIAFFEKSDVISYPDSIMLSDFESARSSKRVFAENFRLIEEESNRYAPRVIVEPYKEGYVVINPPYALPQEGEIDSWYDLPYTKRAHPKYRNKHIPAYEMIKFSINTHRGCFGACSFCTISAHQGKFVVSRSEKSILEEIFKLTQMPEFKGVISDIGGPTANMYGMMGKNLHICQKCKRDSCIYPAVCKNLNISHSRILDLYKKVLSVDGVKRAFVGSGIRYDLFLNESGYLDDSGREYLYRLIKYHTSGRLKVAPEHTEQDVLKAMGKPSFSQFVFLRKEFDRIVKSEKLRYEIVPYFISSHPGCNIEHMKQLSLNPALRGIRLEQVQDFTPTPMTRSSVEYYSGIDPMTGEKIFVEREPESKLKQKNFFLRK